MLYTQLFVRFQRNYTSFSITLDTYRIDSAHAHILLENIILYMRICVHVCGMCVCVCVFDVYWVEFRHT
jgi:hypothetical protein